MRRLALCAVLASSAASAQEAWETFNDKGGTFIRAGSKQGLAVGSELSMYKDGADATVQGTATVMEVWDALARLNLDSAATKAGAKFARLKGATVVPPAVPGAALQGRATKNVVGRINVFN